MTYNPVFFLLSFHSFFCLFLWIVISNGYSIIPTAFIKQSIFLSLLAIPCIIWLLVRAVHSVPWPVCLFLRQYDYHSRGLGKDNTVKSQSPEDTFAKGLIHLTDWSTATIAWRGVLEGLCGSRSQGTGTI